MISLFTKAYMIALCLMEFGDKVNQIGEQKDKSLPQSSPFASFNLGKSNSSRFLNSSLKWLNMQSSFRYNGLHGIQNTRLNLENNLKLENKS